MYRVTLCLFHLPILGPVLGLGPRAGLALSDKFKGKVKVPAYGVGDTVSHHKPNR